MSQKARTKITGNEEKEGTKTFLAATKKEV